MGIISQVKNPTLESGSILHGELRVVVLGELQATVVRLAAACCDPEVLSPIAFSFSEQAGLLFAIGE